MYQFPTTPGNSFAPNLKWIRNSKIAIEFKGRCSKHGKATFIRRNVINLFNVHELDSRRSRSSNTKFTLGDCLFRAVK